MFLFQSQSLFKKNSQRSTLRNHTKSLKSTVRNLKSTVKKMLLSSMERKQRPSPSTTTSTTTRGIKTMTIFKYTMKMLTTWPKPSLIKIRRTKKRKICSKSRPIKQLKITNTRKRFQLDILRIKKKQIKIL